MTSDQAAMLVGFLVAGTTGWNDDSVVVYIDEIQKHNDYEAMGAAVRNVVRTWTEARRPPISTVLDAYRSELSRRQVPRAAITGGGRLVPVADGIEIARKAYEQECQRLGRKPDLAKFDRITERLK